MAAHETMPVSGRLPGFFKNQGVSESVLSLAWPFLYSAGPVNVSETSQHLLHAAGDVPLCTAAI